MAGEATESANRDYFRLEQYQLDNEAQKQRLDAYLRATALPALNRLGIQPVGVFYPEKDLSPVYVLLRHKSLETLLTIQDKLLADPQYVREGADVLTAPKATPAFKRLEVSLHRAFQGMPQLQTPVHAPQRVFQLRIYESPSVMMGLKKIEMFNDAGELTIFHDVGLQAVFFSQTLVGSKMPNLTYMLGFDDAAAMKAAWGRFLKDPRWLALKVRPEYADKTVLCGITNLVLKPAEYSQI
jgi:hypothetical protein